MLTIFRHTAPVNQMQPGPDQTPQDPSAPAPTFDGRVAEILARGEPVAAGRLHMAGIDALSARAGSGGSEIAPKAEGLLQRAIERRLEPGDFYGISAELDFVVLFPASKLQEARLKCAQIADEASRALGEEHPEGDGVSVSVAATILEPRQVRSAISQGGDLVASLGDRIVKAMSSDASVEDPSSAFGHIRFLFRPIWDVRRNAVINFLTVPVVKGAGGRILAGESAVEGLDNRLARLEYDTRLLRRVIDELMRVGSQDRRLLFTIPVHVDTLSVSSARMAYMQLWRDLPLSLQRLTIFDLVGASDGFPLSRMMEILPNLKPLSRAVTFRVPLQSAAMVGRFTHLGLHAISTEVGAGPEKALISDFEKFVVAAEKARLLTYLHAIPTGSLAVAAVAAGFDFIDGAAVGNAEANPKDALRFSVGDLYAKR